MRIISGNYSAEQVQKDMERIKKAHQEGLKHDVTWRFFGGLIEIDGRTYQVIPTGDDFKRKSY